VVILQAIPVPYYKIMTTMVVGSSGATGKQLVEQLLKMGQKVKVIIRRTGEIPDTWHNHDDVSIINANITEIHRIQSLGFMGVSGEGSRVTCQNGISRYPDHGSRFTGQLPTGKK
jgi:hypothetical protein